MTEFTLAASEDAPSKSVVARASGPHRSAMLSSPAGDSGLVPGHPQSWKLGNWRAWTR
jgi:hypothetical protein